MTWGDLADAHHNAALWLMGRGDLSHQRAVCGRAYYSSYALVTSKLPSGIRFGRGWSNPPHEKLPAYVDMISGLDLDKRRRIKIAIRRLRQRREDADYRPGIAVSKRDAVESLRDAAEVRRLLSGDRNG